MLCGKTAAGMAERTDKHFPAIRCFEAGVEGVVEEAEADNPGCIRLRDRAGRAQNRQLTFLRA